jgi:hypothetical protein
MRHATRESGRAPISLVMPRGRVDVYTARASRSGDRTGWGTKNPAMRVVLILAVVVVFVALLVIDTAALLRLTVYCVSGGCGVPPMWIAICGGVVVFCAWMLFRRRPVVVKKARATKSTRPRGPRRQTARRKVAK